MSSHCQSQQLHRVTGTGREILGVLLDEDETYVNADLSAARPTRLFALTDVQGQYIQDLPEIAPKC